VGYQLLRGIDATFPPDYQERTIGQPSTEEGAAMREVLLLLALGLSAPSADVTHRTENFVVTAPTEKIARQVGEAAERHRKAIARRWLGKTLPAWPARCPLRVKITINGTAGSSTFIFDKGKVLSQSVEVEGLLDAILNSSLPHEITHTVLDHHFGQPVPRWADEGASVLSENAAERQRHEKLARKILDEKSRAIPLKRLFAVTQYPPDVMVLFAEGASVTRFLVNARGRRTFLAFVKDGMAGGWDAAVRRHYGYADVAKLEEAWLKSDPEDAVEPP
jgi:hypothetical protein